MPLGGKGLTKSLHLATVALALSCTFTMVTDHVRGGDSDSATAPTDTALGVMATTAVGLAELMPLALITFAFAVAPTVAALYDVSNEHLHDPFS
jgi:hypothetical protein